VKSTLHISIGLCALVFVLIILELTFGPVSIPLCDVFQILTNKEPDNPAWETIIMDSRLPRALTAAIGGGALALGGLLMQTLFRNALASPDILGVTGGASLGVALMLLSAGASGTVFSSVTMDVPIALSAMAGAIGVLFFILLVAHRIADNLTLIIFGVMFSFLSGAWVSALQFKSTAESLRSFIVWGMGSFAEADFGQIIWMAVILIFAFIIILLILPRLNLLLLGENYASSMGLNVKRTRLILLIVTGVLTGIVTAFCGPISFIGLAVPHIARMLTGTSDHNKLLFPLVLSGCALGLLSDLGARYFELPVNTIASAWGAPFILFILWRGARSKAII
jgi:iron complex transport system permease protein